MNNKLGRWGKSSFLQQAVNQIKVEGITELETHHLVTTRKKCSRGHQRVLKLVDPSLTGNKVVSLDLPQDIY